MATASVPLQLSPQQDQTPPLRKRTRRRSTSHLKIVPETKALRQQIRAKCLEVAAKLDKSRPLSKEEMETIVRATLADMGLPEGYVGWTLVMMTSAFWADQVAATPPSRRLFLLPHCLKHAEGCPADYDDFGLDCKECGACSIADFRTIAEELGYKVLVAEGSPIVLKIIVSGYIDAIVGVACLNVLEKAFDKILLAGIPCMAIPLLSSDCRNTSVDEDWVQEMINVKRSEPVQQTRTYVHLMRAASGLFKPDELQRLSPRLRAGSSEVADLNLDKLSPIAATEAIAYDFLSKGGKHSRPFITLAVYDALTGGKGTLSGGSEHVEKFSNAVKCAALSIETFHKASLVHDDIEDEDPFRYGEQTLHCKYGIASAINVGDYLIGKGYRLITQEAKTLGADTVADILDSLADAHLRLSEGQGAELVWRDRRDKQLKPIDALKIYALKTAPAFEAALYMGVRLAQEVGGLAEPIKLFARNLGVAFQILNDLKDWQGDQNNKLSAGGDVIGGRPTILWALALEGLDQENRSKLEALQSDHGLSNQERIRRVLHLYRQADVFEKTSLLVEKYQDRAEEIADHLPLEELRRLFYFLIDTVLERTPEYTPAIVSPPITIDLPIVTQ